MAQACPEDRSESSRVNPASPGTRPGTVIPERRQVVGPPHSGVKMPRELLSSAPGTQEVQETPAVAFPENSDE